ncbi:MAG: metallophosphoesterase [Geminicoccaceae bacterium]
MRIIQLSDSHLSCDKPTRIEELEACVRHINAMRPQPDVVVHTGDIAHDGLVDEYVIARHSLDQLAAPYFVLPGNRDDRGNLVKVFADNRSIRSDAEFVQYVVEDFDIRLIMIDTVSTESNKGHLCGKRLNHIEQMLMADASQSAVLFLHHPPFQVDVGPDPYNFEDWSDVEALMALCQRRDRLVGFHCGHVHRTFETSIRSAPASVVSSVASDLRWDSPNGPNSELPVFKLHSISTEP